MMTATQGTMPFKVQYVDSTNPTTFASQPTGQATMMPSIFNADTLGSGRIPPAKK